MNYRSRLKQYVVVSVVLWLLALSLVGYLTFQSLMLPLWVGLIVLLIAAAAVSLMAINQSQLHVAEVNKQHSRTKRLVQEHQLKIDRFEYDAKKSGEIRRIVLNSTQEKDHSLRNMAQALDHVMNEIVELTENTDEGALGLIRTRAEGMKRYAADLQALAKLELKSEIPVRDELDFIKELNSLSEGWSALAKMRKIKIKLDNPEDQIPLYSDLNWIDNLLSRVVQALLRMNENTVLHLHLIGYLDAEMGDALRIGFSIDGRQFSEQQLKHLMTEYVSIIEDGQEVGPGLSFVVARRMAQMLNGTIDIDNSARGVEVLVVLPRNPEEADRQDEMTYN